VEREDGGRGGIIGESGDERAMEFRMCAIWVRKKRGVGLTVKAPNCE
jgi:hypothetical protein